MVGLFGGGQYLYSGIGNDKTFGLSVEISIGNGDFSSGTDAVDGYVVWLDVEFELWDLCGWIDPVV